jgi:hypothetical protein
MSTIICAGLYTWTLTLEGGEVRQVLASTLASALGYLPVVAAQRGVAVPTALPPAVLTSLVPSTAALGAPDFTLHVHGTGCQPSDQILWNGAPEPTTFVSATELTTLVNMATAQAAIPVPVAVRNAVGEVSNSLTFTLTATAARAADDDRDR